MLNALLVKRIDKLIDLANSLKQARYIDKDNVKQEMLYGKWLSQTTSCLTDIFGGQDTYTTNFKKTCGFINFPNIDEGIGILTAAKEDIENGYVNGLFGLLSAEIFSDVLEMSEHLLKEKYKDAAAVIIGTALEAHLRNICKKHNLPLDYTDNKGELKVKKASVLNSDLCKQTIYNKLDEKLVTAWLDLRNKAAHGQFGDYTLEQVENMLIGVTDFINRTK